MLEDVWRVYQRGRRELVALRDVSLEIERGEVVGVWGRRFSGRTTLLRVAAGLEAPDQGRVLLDGVELSRCGEAEIRRRVAFCHSRFAAAHGDQVVEQVAVPLLARGLRMDSACIRAQTMLERLGIGELAELPPNELDHGELIRVAIARATLARPDLLLIDEPTNGVELLERDALLAAIRSLASDFDMAVVMTGAETTGLVGADRTLSLSGGELRGETIRSAADVVPFPRPRAEPAG